MAKSWFIDLGCADVWSRSQTAQLAGVGASAILRTATEVLRLYSQAYITNLSSAWAEDRHLLILAVGKVPATALAWDICHRATNSKVLPGSSARSGEHSHGCFACGHPALAAQGASDRGYCSSVSASLRVVSTFCFQVWFTNLYCPELGSNKKIGVF